MTDELKPVRCGCGGEAIILSFENLDNSISVYVSCSKCHTSTVSFCGEQAKSNAIEAWNKAMGERAPLAKVNEIATRSYCGECGERLDDYDDICGEPPIKYCPMCGARLEWK